MMKSLRGPRLFLLVLLVVASQQRAHAQVTETTLANGLRVIVQPSRLVKIVSLDAWVGAGTSREEPAHPGVAHYLEHVLFKGTPTRPTEESIDAAVENLGGSFNAATSYDWAHFYTTVPSPGFAPTLDVLADVLQHASISAAMVESERPVILSEVARNDSEPTQSLDFLARSLIYGTVNAYGRSITGDEDQVRAVTRDQIDQFYRTNYVPSNITLVVTGDVTPDQVREAATRVFAAWKTPVAATAAATALSSPVPSLPAPGIRRQILRREERQSYLVMAFDAPSVKDTPDVWTMDILLTLLGQGGNNRLDTVLHRSTHLVTEIGADFLTQRNPGVLTITAAMPTGNLDAVEASILAQIKLLRDAPIPEDEIEAAKLALKSSYLFDSETVSGRSDTLGFYSTIDTYEYDTHYLDRCRAVTAADVQRVARKYLTPDSYALVALVPRTDAMTAANAAPLPPKRMASFP